MRISPLLPAAFFAALFVPAAFADDAVSRDVEIHNHVFAPAEINVPAGKPIALHIKNMDTTAEEFDSSALKVEKVIGGNGAAVVHLRPLAPGRYKFEGEYHEKTAQGVVIAQ